MSAAEVVLLASCPDRGGIRESMHEWVSAIGAELVESRTVSDGRLLFARMVFRSQRVEAELHDRFADLARRHQMQWQIHARTRKPQLLVMVSRQTHCLEDLLARQQRRVLPGEIVGVVSNHPDARSVAKESGVRFRHIPVIPGGKPTAEARLRKVIDEWNPDVVVLARYMQVLSPGLIEDLESSGRTVINIHHGDLPTSPGARPYQQALERGVKAVGATCHYVTAQLDGGPIIAQQWRSIAHLECPSEANLAKIGRGNEIATLTEGLYLHCTHRIIRHGHRTAIFRRPR